jgi:hypothetical protein
LTAQLFDHSIHTFSSEGFEGNLRRAPEPLIRHLGSLARHHEKLPVSADLAFRIAPNENPRFRMDFLRIAAEDGGEVLVSYDDPFTKLLRTDQEYDFDDPDNELECFLGSDLMDQSLRALFPRNNPEIAKEQIARAIFTNSPKTSHSAEARDETLYLFTEESETVDNSVRSVEVHVRYDHQCDKTVLLKASVEEMLSDSMAGFGAVPAMTLGAGRIIKYNEVIDGKVVPVKKPRLSHAIVLREAIERFLDKSWPERGSVSPWETRKPQ